ncbi:MAG: hypothetical protein ACKO1J_06075, partial [Tagaea sp.]
VRDKGMQNAAGYMAGQVRHLGQEGVVEARDFVDQLDKLMPGEGTKAIRGILQSLADIPGLQRAFFGGPVIETAPIGVFEHDGLRRFDEAMKTKPWEDAEQGRKIPGGNQTREWDEARDGPRPTPQLRPMTDADAEKHQVQLRDAGAEANAPPNPADLLDPRNWPEAYRTQALASRDEPLEAEATAKDEEDQDAHAIQIAQAQGQPQRPAPTPIPPQEPFRALLAQRETQNREGLTNTTKGTDQRPQEVLGLYQLSRDILVDAGLKNRDGSWREGNAAGVSSDDEFLKNREAQDKALAHVLGEYSRQIKAAGADRIVGQQIAGIRAPITVTESGLIAAAHRGGIGNLQTYINRMEANGWDSNRALAGIEKETSNPDRRTELEDWHKRVETRLREFGPLNLR